MSQHIEVASGRGVAVVWLGREQAHNALDADMVSALTQTFKQLGQDSHYQAIVLAGRGDSFCSGIDVGWLRQAAAQGHIPVLVSAVQGMLDAIHHCPSPVIARLHGNCLGLGVGIVAAADMAIASHGASFCLPETRLGMIPNLSSPYLVRAIGERAAKRWAMSGETFSASEAWRLGLLQDICNDEELDARINILLGSLVMANPQAVRATKQLIGQLHDPSTHRPHLESAPAKSYAQSKEPHYAEGINAFLEKRWPSWAPKAPEDESP